MSFEYLNIASELHFLLVPEKPFIETWEWNTNIIQAKNGNEQRIAYREYPRRYYRASCSIINNRDYRDWRKFMFNDLGYGLRVILPQYCFYLTRSANPGDRSIFFDQELYGFDVLDEICIVNEDNTDFSFGAISQVSKGSVILSDPPNNYHPVGNRVYPIAPMRVLDDSSITINHTTGSCDLNLICTDKKTGFAELDKLPENPIITCDEKLVLHLMPLSGSGMRCSYTRQHYVLDNEICLPLFTTKYRRSFHSFLSEWYIDRGDNKSLLWWKYFLCSIRGQQQPFLMSSWQEDFFGSLSNYAGDIINLIGTEFLNIYYRHDGTKYLHVRASNGDHYCRVTSATESGGGEVTVRVDPPISKSVNERVYSISLLYLVRLNNDAVTFTHEDRHSIIRLYLRTVNE